MNSKIELSQIPQNSEYEGYIWMSDQQKPESDSSKLNAMLNKVNSDNPFIVEGQLYDQKNKKSFSITYIDGEYIVNQYSMTEEEVKEDSKAFIPNRIPNLKAIKFVQRWRVEPDPLCNDMEVFVPAESVFVGFEKNKE